MSVSFAGYLRSKKMKSKCLLFAAIFAALCPLLITAQASHPLLQRPSFNGNLIVFSYAGDLWTVDRNGGRASRLTAGTGIETDPVFSPDGTMIAFTAEYDGNTDVFVVPAAGGVPNYLRFHWTAAFPLPCRCPWPSPASFPSTENTLLIRR